ncbi:MAG: aminotransferase class I/II-fold pyridoxal phosphate-dependent enzyme, partial [Lachnospiraceae bacterium]
IKDCYEKISNERKYLKDSLEKLKDLKVYPTFGNFILCEIVSKKIDAGELYERLISKAAAIRNCSNFKTLDKYFFRICVLKHEQNDFLINLLNDIFIDKLSL